MHKTCLSLRFLSATVLMFVYFFLLLWWVILFYIYQWVIQRSLLKLMQSYCRIQIIDKSINSLMTSRRAAAGGGGAVYWRNDLLTVDTDLLGLNRQRMTDGIYKRGPSVKGQSSRLWRHWLRSQRKGLLHISCIVSIQV